MNYDALLDYVSPLKVAQAASLYPLSNRQAACPTPISATAGLDHRLFVSRYLVALPKPEDIQRLIGTDRAVWEQHHPHTQSSTGCQPVSPLSDRHAACPILLSAAWKQNNPDTHTP